jgi:hypothetical protein
MTTTCRLATHTLVLALMLGAGCNSPPRGTDKDVARKQSALACNWPCCDTSCGKGEDCVNDECYPSGGGPGPCSLPGSCGGSTGPGPNPGGTGGPDPVPGGGGGSPEPQQPATCSCGAADCVGKKSSDRCGSNGHCAVARVCAAGGGFECTCAACKPAGEICNGPSNCCSGICTDGKCVSCKIDGEACGIPSDCCTGVCTNGKCGCMADGASGCTSGSQCCSGNCVAWGFNTYCKARTIKADDEFMSPVREAPAPMD